jgi:hypothetical protein
MKVIQTDKYRAKIEQFAASNGWGVTSSDTKKIRLSVPFSLWSFGENVDIVFDGDETMELTSTCRWPFQVQDWGKNKTNIDRLLASFVARPEIR